MWQSAIATSSAPKNVVDLAAEFASARNLSFDQNTGLAQD